MNLKTLISLGVLAGTGAVVLGKNKLGNYSSVLENMEVELKGIHRVKLGDPITFETDVQITNNTPTAINLPGKNLLVKTIHFFTLTGKKIAIAHPNIADINLPANGSRLITNIPVVVNINDIGNNLSEILGIVSDKNNLRLQVEIEAFGKSFTINA